MSITVQRGVTLMTGDAQDVTLGTAVDLSRSFVLVDVTTDAAVSTTYAENWLATGQLTDSTTLALGREGSTVQASVAWEIVTCDEGEFWVQRGQTTINSGNTTTTDAITEVDQSRSMIILSNRGDFSGSTTHLGFANMAFTSNVQVGFERAASSTVRTYIYYEVVEWSQESGVTVTAGRQDVSGDLSTGTTIAHGATVTTDNTWLTAYFHHDTSGLEQCSLAVTFDATNLTVQRHTTTTSYTSNVFWQLVTFPKDICYQYTDVMATGDSIEDTPITAITTANTIIFGSNSTAGTGTAFGRNAVASTVTSTTNIRSSRSYTGQACEISLSVIDLSGWNHSQLVQYIGQT